MPYCLLSYFSDTVVPNILSKSLLGHKRLHTQTNALAKQSLKDLLLLYGDHKAG